MARKILIIAEYEILNGGERSLLAVLPYLKEAGWQMSVLLPKDEVFGATDVDRRLTESPGPAARSKPVEQNAALNLNEALSTMEIPTIRLAKFDQQGNRLTQTEMRSQIAGQLIRDAPNLIHCNSLSTSRLCGPVARRLGIPAIGHLRDIIKLSRRAIEDLNELSQIIAVSQATRDWHVNHGIAAERTVVIYNGVDLKTFSPRCSPWVDQRTPDWRHTLHIDAAAPVLLFVGQIGLRKGIDVLLAAFEIIARVDSSCHLLIVGERNSLKEEAIVFETTLHDATARSDVSPRIHWLSRRSDIPDLMRESTLLVHPARQEPLGRVLLEAAASGLPMITTNVGGSSEILAGMESWQLIQPVDAELIAGRVLKLLQNENQRLEISRQLRQIAETRFSAESTAKAISAIYLNWIPD